MTEQLDSCRCDDVAAHLAWVADAVGSPVEGHRHLVGGMASTVIQCSFDDRPDPLVLRAIDDRELLAREPDIIHREAEALRILMSVQLQTPNIVAAEYTPEVGRLLMTWVDGRIVIDGNDLDERTAAIAAVAADIAATPLPHDHRLSPWRSWTAADPVPPTWGDPGLWREAIAVHQGRSASGPPGRAAVLLHRDLHPLNILWGDGPAVVDWVNACVGHPHAELGHCRWNLYVTSGPRAAQDFLDRYVELTADRGYGHYDPWWDLDSLLDKVSGPIGTSGWQAVGRLDLTVERVAAATNAFLCFVLSG